MHLMMKCGHAANATRKVNGEDFPCCVICAGIDPGADIVDDSPPSLEGRTSKCSSCKGVGKGRYTGTVAGTAPSSPDLPFFEHLPNSPFDKHYCGCWGWD